MFSIRSILKVGTLTLASRVLGFVRDGRMRALAIGSAQRSPLMPDVPTFSEAGMPAFDRYTWFGMFAPAGTPKDIVARVNAEVAAALKAPDLLERFAAAGAEAVGSTPELFIERIKSDATRWAEVIRAANVKVQ